MGYIQYPAAQAALDVTQDYDVNRMLAFNTIMEKIKEYVKLDQTSLDILEVSSFQHFNLTELFVAQGYDITQIGVDPILKFIISW